MPRTVILTVILILSSSCARMVEKAVDKTKYSALETIGIEKRDIFKRNVSSVKEEQEDTGEAFKDALTELKELYKVDGGKLEKHYNRLNNSYEDARAEAGEAKRSIEKMHKVASDLFDEWGEEIKEIETKDLRRKSREQLGMTREKYGRMLEQLRESEKRMQPILTRFKDQVLFLKHNLNAQAIGGLKDESNRIQGDIDRLMKEMQEASKEADELIRTL